MRITCCLFFAACWVTALAVGAPSIPAEGAPEAPYRVPHAISEIRIDGTLDETAWDSALSFELGYEVRPGENITPPVRTEILLTFDQRQLYVAFRAFDPDPSSIRARYSDRDRTWEDDWVGILLDTFNDQRRGYEMIANPLGVQTDAINDEAGGRYDDSWNAIWDSAGLITDDGYDIEMAIPFDQIRFQSTSGDQIWGFDAFRSVPRHDRHHIGLFPRDRSNSSYLSQTVKLIGMAEASPGKNLEIVPTLTASRTDARESLPDGDLDEADSTSDLGLTVRWGITPDTTLHGTLNPDFSQVEADAVRLDINEQFAVFFPETRPFFLEQRDTFNTGLGLVHTRTVADPSGAVKFTGKQARHTYGLFSARDQVTNMIFPGAESSSGDSFSPDNTTSVGRYRFDLGESSTIGAAITDRRGGDYSNQVFSADTLYRITDADTLELSAAWSRTSYSDEMIAEADVSGETLTDEAFALNYNHNVRDFWTNFNYTRFGEDYRSDAGFRPQVGFDRWTAGGARVWWGAGGDLFRRIGLGGDVDRTTRYDGDLLEEEIETWLNLQGPRQSSIHFGLGRRNRVFEGVEFEQWFGSASFNFQATRNWRVGMGGNGGDWIDFDHVRPADQLALWIDQSYRFGRHLLLEYRHTYRTLDVEDGQLFRIHVPEARIVHQFNRRAFVRAIFQYTDIRRNIELYDTELEAEPRSKDLLAQLLFNYKVNAPTALYLGYTDNYIGNQDFDLTQAERTFFFKIGYAWVP